MRSLKRIHLSLIGVMLLLLAACRTLFPSTTVPYSPENGGPEAAVLADLESIDQLQIQFNEDVGRPRLLMILAPT